MDLSILLFLVLLLFQSFELFVDYLHAKRAKLPIPEELKDLAKPDQAEKTYTYLMEHYQHGLYRSLTQIILLGILILGGGYEWLDQLSRSLSGSSVIFMGLVFFGLLTLISKITTLPFQWSETFGIEQKYGFNQTTKQTFVSDQIKGIILMVLLGAPLLSFLIWFFDRFPENGWLYSWIFFAFIQVLLLWAAPAFIMPLFNKFEPLPDGELKNKIFDLAKKLNFQVQELYTMDGSKRSTKANAFFTGFGKNKRIVLFDTLIEKLTHDELLGVLAHEIGHYKMKHTLQFLALSMVTTFLGFFVLGKIMFEPKIYEAFNVTTPSIHAGLLFVSILFAPFSKILSLFTQGLSRKFEFEADEYSLKHFPNFTALKTALKKLSVDHLSHMNPHWLKVLLDYSHPPVLERVKAIHELKNKTLR